MPRRKQNPDDNFNIGDNNKLEETPLRRSKRILEVKNTVQKLDMAIATTEGSTSVNEALFKKSRFIPMNEKDNDQKPKVNQTILLSEQRKIKPPKSVFKKLKMEDETLSPKVELNSLDNGVSSRLNLKDGSCSLSKMSKTELCTEKSFDEPLITDSNNTHDIQIKKSSEKPKRQKKEKLKVDTTLLSNKNEKRILSEKETEILLDPVMKEKLFLEENNNSAFIANEHNLSVEKTNILQVLTQYEVDVHSECKTSGSKSFNPGSCGNSSSESDWEEVKERTEMSLDDYNPIIPKDGVEITIDCPELNVRKRKKKQFDHMEYIRLHINRELKEHQLNVHKAHILCLLAHGLFVNNILNTPLLKALALSYLPSDMLTIMTGRKIDKANSDVIRNMVSWFREAFSFENKQLPFIDFQGNMPNYFQEQKSYSSSEYNLMFLVFARTLGFKTRLCISFYPVSHKAENLLKKPCSKKRDNLADHDPKEKLDIKTKKSATTTQKNSKKKTIVIAKDKITELDSTMKETKPQSKRTTNKRSISKCYKMSSEEDEDFVERNSKRIKQEIKTGKKLSKKRSNRKVLSSDSEPDSSENCNFGGDKIICWCEVFSKPDKQWISIECTNNIIDKPYDIEKILSQPVTYILAYDNDCYVKDVTKRYCNEYMTSTLKLRADSDWWEETLEYFESPNSKLIKDEEKKLDEMLVKKPLPKTIGEYKNHPLYALKRHLLKFEAIYPPDAAPVGFIREEPVYARDNVCKLHSRETWVKEARVVRIGEEPYKIVKARPKWDRIAGVMRTDLPLAVFGFWQTEQYEPPVAEGGKVPRNEYGNVELFKPCMLPRGTVHLQIPGLNRVAKKLGIDCSPAVVGFDGHKGSIHPVFDGFVVCKEFKDTLLAAWDEEQVNARKRDEEKREKRIYGNWKKLIKGLLIRERIKLKYDVK